MDEERIVHRRIEITVEREVITQLDLAATGNNSTGPPPGEQGAQRCENCGAVIATPQSPCTAHIATLPEQYPANPAKPQMLFSPSQEVK
jgi:hypothetical protein